MQSPDHLRQLRRTVLPVMPVTRTDSAPDRQPGHIGCRALQGNLGVIWHCTLKSEAISINPLRAAGARECSMQKSLDRGWFPCQGHHRDHHGKPMGRDGSRSGSADKVLAIKMQRINKMPTFGQEAETYNLSCGFEVRHRGREKITAVQKL